MKLAQRRVSTESFGSMGKTMMEMTTRAVPEQEGREEVKAGPHTHDSSSSSMSTEAFSCCLLVGNSSFPIPAAQLASVCEYCGCFTSFILNSLCVRKIRGEAEAEYTFFCEVYSINDVVMIDQ
jgi:hypothetical protein